MSPKSKKNPRQTGTPENQPQPQRRQEEMPGHPNSKPASREPGSRDSMPHRRQGS
ncbi:hypothetical protein [Acrocarpospora catenulata]|uniref:hypothetical protein n=1 Tax=Acrocarpospora catenulata TaxID=2836182 RepID=UPI001BD9F822|nr:hypothetical protein [Acrocarpospora catenulata]